MELKYSNLAKQDLASIEKYTRENWGGNQADLYLAQIENKILDLLETPYLGTARPDISVGYRCVPEGKHLIFYRVDTETLTLTAIDPRLLTKTDPPGALVHRFFGPIFLAVNC